MNIISFIRLQISNIFQENFNYTVTPEAITVNETTENFKGDYTVVLFAFAKPLRISPDKLGDQLGQLLLQEYPDHFESYEVVKGFLNITIHNNWLLKVLHQHHALNTEHVQKVMVEYASPNTNKPLHLGHLRNIFLGWSVSEIMKAAGHDVVRSCVVNDRGVHICKSMLAWKKFAGGATPESTAMKGDHFVGDYYVKFENALRAEAQPVYEELIGKGSSASLNQQDDIKAKQLYQKLNLETTSPDAAEEIKDALKEIARNSTSLMQEVRSMLVKWEQGDEETVSLWKKMNGWVYDGFDETYQRIGASFDFMYYESETYLLGKDDVEAGLKNGVFYKKEDGSVWIDLTAEGLDEKLVLRKDGTSVYITQDIGLARKKFEDYPMQQSIYVIGDEQNYHMDVLKAICKRLQMPFADGIYHLSYGMVDLPTGRMKSREGTVVDADDLCDEMEAVAAAKTAELGKVDNFTSEELRSLYRTLAMGALKFYLLRVDPAKRMVFNPEESIDFHGYTGPFVQYTYARIKSLLRKAGDFDAVAEVHNYQLAPAERKLVLLLEQFKLIIRQSAAAHNPSAIASYTYQLAKAFNSFYALHSVLQAEDDTARKFRLIVAGHAASTIKEGLGLLGIEVPERM